MKRRFFRPGLLAAILMIFIALPAVSLADDDEPRTGLGLARVTYINGDTLFNSLDTDDWAALSPNFSLREGDRLWAGEESKLEVGFSGGHYAWLNYESELDMTRLERGDRGDTYQMGVPSGEASFMVKRFGADRSVFQVDTPNASVRAYGKARFRVSALSDGSSQVGVSEGSVEVESDEGITDIRAGEMAEVYPDGEVHITGLPDEDAWDRWVDSRAHRYARPARSARYLPAEMEPYAYEFDTGGRWVSYPEYGRVWVPVVDTGWSPYSNGRWCWVAGDYVWLPYDPWYAPFHYGRWSWSVSLGWFWAPPITRAVYWSPGYVSWVWGPDYVGWVPLAPREVYYGYGYYGPHSVNIHKTKVVNVTNVYVNSRVNNGVVIVNKNKFAKGDFKRIVIKDKSQNPFLSRKALRAEIIGRPPVKEIKPTRELKLPKPHVKPAARALPPARVEKLAPVVTKRSVAREPQESVLKPGAKPRKLEREVLKERRAAEKGERKFRSREVSPSTVPATPQVKEKDKPGRLERHERMEKPDRPEAETPKGVEKERPERGKSGDVEMPGRTRPAPQRERIERAPRERVRPEQTRGEEAVPERRGIERAPEAVPETRPALPERERGTIERPDRDEREARPARRSRESAFEDAAPAERERPAKVRREAPEEGKNKGEGKKKKEQKEDKKEADE